MAGMRLEKRILIVDDDDAIRALLMTVLRRRGFVADSARNGVEALEHLAACRYSLVVLDLMMPRMSGYELLDHLGGMPPSTRPPVLVLTAGLEPTAVRHQLRGRHDPQTVRHRAAHRHRRPAV